MKPFERLGEARTPNGTLLELFRHDGSYLIRAGGIELMSTRRHLSEDRLAEVACAPIRDTPNVRVLIGGLGLGFTLRAACRALRDDAEIVVAELLSEVIAWNTDPAYNISVDALADPRVHVVHDDVTRVLLANVAGFDAIMLDTDNGPDGMLISENEALYVRTGIDATIAALRPGGLIVYWSVGNDPRFVAELRRARLHVETMHVRAHDTVRATHTLYIAKLGKRVTDAGR
jgi:spermidine synthase